MFRFNLIQFLNYSDLLISCFINMGDFLYFNGLNSTWSLWIRSSSITVNNCTFVVFLYLLHECNKGIYGLIEISNCIIRPTSDAVTPLGIKVTCFRRDAYDRHDFKTLLWSWAYLEARTYSLESTKSRKMILPKLLPNTTYMWDLEMIKLPIGLQPYKNPNQ